MNIIQENQELICGEAVETFGHENQINMMTEEIGELLSALNKYRRGRVGLDEVRTEIADVIIMAVQMAFIFGYYETTNEIDNKISRLSRKMYQISNQSQRDENNL